MTNLTIKQNGTGGVSVKESISTQIMQKLYDSAKSVSEPQLGQQDNAYISGHISVPHTYKFQVNYLAGTIGEGESGVITSQRSNPDGRFQDLQIDVTSGYYAYVADKEVNRILSHAYGDGIGVTKFSLSNIAENSIRATTMFQSNPNIRVGDLRGFSQNLGYNTFLFKYCSHITDVYINKISEMCIKVAYGGNSNINSIIIGEVTKRLIGEPNDQQTINTLAVRNYSGTDSHDQLFSDIVINNLYLGGSSVVPLTFGMSLASRVLHLYVPSNLLYSYQTSNWSTCSSIQSYDFENDPDNIFAPLTDYESL